MKALMEV